jgi:hypothetical protein
MNKEINIVVFTGKKRSGKTTAGKYLVEKHNYVRMRFAQTLKDMLYEFGLTDAEVDGELKELPCVKLGGKTPVQAMQTLGTEWGRDCMYLGIWTDALNRELEFHIEMGLKRFVIDDLRFLNEKEYIDKLREKYNVLVIGIERVRTVVGEHRSETEMDNILSDRGIENNGSIEELYKNVNRVMSMYGIYDRE